MIYSRRDLLRAGSLAGLGMRLRGSPVSDSAGSGPDVSCILLLLVGGPSQLDTWDPKPDAPAEIRGPYRAIPTNVSGLRISEIFPRMARHADKYAVVRSVYHTGPAVHETGWEILGEGPETAPSRSRLRTALADWEAVTDWGAVTNWEAVTDWGAVTEARKYDGLRLRRPPEAVQDRYGRNRFGASCLLARQLVEAGVRFVTVRMFESVFQETTWDIHGSAPFSPLSCYGDRVGPMFDAAYSALLEDLHQRGLLDRTLVVATGEFGRTPWINPAGGRDHWPQCWTMLFAGGGVRGGQVIGESDAIAAAPKNRPVALAEVNATIDRALGIPPRGGVRPVEELFV
jgi:uncharacterized protein (DUF1501 family)